MILTKEKTFYKSLFSLALPIALQGLLGFAFTFSDSIMTGGLGDGAVAGVYLGGQIQLLLQISCLGIDGALILLASHHWGRRNTEAVSKISTIALCASAVLGLFFTLSSSLFPKGIISLFTNGSDALLSGAEYLSVIAPSFILFSLTQSLIASMRSVEAPWAGLAAASASLSVKLVLNYAFIFGKLGAPALGIRGAALSTLISRACELLLATVCLFIVNKKSSVFPKKLARTDKDLVIKFFKYGLPVMAGQLVWALNNLLASAIMGRSGGEGVLAGLSSANAINGISYAVITGASGALSIIIGKTVGAEKDNLVKEYSKTAQILFFALGLLCCAAILILSRPFLTLYGTSAVAKGHAMNFIKIFALLSIATSYQSACLVGLIKSGGDSRFTFLCDLFLILFAVLPLSISAMRLSFPPWALLLALKLDQPLKCIAGGIKVNKFNWIKNLTKDEDCANTRG